MSFLQKGLLQIRTPFTEFRRFRGKIHIRRPRKPHYVLQQFLDITAPQYPSKKDLPEYAICGNIKSKFMKKKIDNPLEHILAKECANWFNHSKMIAFFHANSINAEDLSIFRKTLKREGMYLKQYGKVIVEEAVLNTPYEAVLSLFNSHTHMIFSEENKSAKMLSIARKTPQLIFMAGIIDGKFLSKNTFVEYSKFPSLEVMQSKLCNVLLSSGLQLTNQLMQHQTALVNNLDAYVKMKQSEENKDGSD